MTLEHGDIDQEEIAGERRMRVGCFYGALALLITLLAAIGALALIWRFV